MEAWIQKMWYMYTLQYYSAIKNDEFVRILGKWIKLESILCEVTQSEKKHTWYVLTDMWILAQKLRIPKVQFTNHMKRNKEGRPKCGYFHPS